MNFLIADSFTTSLGRLTGAEQKVVKTTAFDLQLDPTGKGKSFHKLERAKDKGFWSVRVSADLRIIVHRSASKLLLCYVGHHDDAYRWAERRRIDRHPTTGAAQLVELVEQQVVEPAAAALATSAHADDLGGPFDSVDDATLLAYGVPTEWLHEVRRVREDGLFDLLEHLPAEAAEALLELATGGKPALPVRTDAVDDPFAHPDAQRRFRLVGDMEELARALDYPWDRWTVFLHPAQRQLVERRYAGPVRVAGSAGTGKTIVALHRAVATARAEPDARVLLTTFSSALARNLRTKLHRLIDGEPRLAERIDVRPLHDLARDLHARLFGQPALADPATVRTVLAEAMAAEGAAGLSAPFLLAEWEDVVDAWQLDDWDAYRAVPRLGRKTRLGAKQREAAWRVMAAVRRGLQARGLVTGPMVLARVTADLAARERPLYDAAVVDEAQDVAVAELRLLRALTGERADALFFAGDLGQRIFQPPFSWKALGIDVRGRSFTLKINYRTSHQIRTQADRLLPGTVSDVDGNAESRRGTISVFDGPAPLVQVCDDVEAEQAAVADWIRARRAEAMEPAEIGVFVRSEAEIERALRAVTHGGEVAARIDQEHEPPAGRVAVGTMHLAKGLEFRAVAVMACDDEVLPLQARIEAIGDEADLEEVYATERHLLYVACTRARERLLVTGVDPASEFLDDLRA